MSPWGVFQACLDVQSANALPKLARRENSKSCDGLEELNQDSEAEGAKTWGHIVSALPETVVFLPGFGFDILSRTG
jgi:hypothetical protein